MNTSDLDYIDVRDSNPFVLLNEWLDEYKARSNGPVCLMNLATATKDGIPNNRTVLLEDVANETFRFFSMTQSPKAHEIEENPNVSICVIMQYEFDGKHVTRQVRAEGAVKRLSKEDSKYIYDRKDLFAKIRSLLYNYFTQSDVVDWNELKMKHDELLKLYEDGQLDMSMPDKVAAFEITPRNVQFYSAHDYLIGDRVKFDKIGGDSWEYHHLVA